MIPWLISNTFHPAISHSSAIQTPFVYYNCMHPYTLSHHVFIVDHLSIILALVRKLYRLVGTMLKFRQLYTTQHICPFTNSQYISFLHDQPWISPSIKSISYELDIIIHVIAVKLFCHCDVVNNRLWRHQQNVNWASATLCRCMKTIGFIVIMDSLCRVRNKIMHVLSWRNVYAFIRVLFRCLFPPLLRNLGNKHQNNPLVSTETVRHSSTYIILFTVDTLGCQDA